MNISSARASLLPHVKRLALLQGHKNILALHVCCIRKKTDNAFILKWFNKCSAWFCQIGGGLQRKPHYNSADLSCGNSRVCDI